jgi:cobalt-zinc-cadmium efflux system outer membrane protein
MEDGLSSDEAVAVALWNNPEFQATLATLGIARADLVQAGLLKNPVLSLLFPWGPKQFEATATWAIDAIWQRPARVEDARLNVEALAAELVSHGLKLAADVRLALIDVRADERALALVTEQAALSARLSEMAAGRLRAGDISEFDARLAATAAAGHEAARLSRLAARDVGVIRLRSLLGLVREAPAVQLATPVDSLDRCGDVASLIEVARAARPDVRAAELQVEAAAARAGLERAKVIALTAALDMNGQGREGFEAGPGLSVELPIFARNDGGRARAAADLELRSRRYVAVQAAVNADVQAAHVALTLARSASETLNARLGDSLAAERRQAQSQYDAGEISLLDLLDIRRRLNEAELMRVDADASAARALVRLETAVGRRCGR